jgi:hypothetical protein
MPIFDGTNSITDILGDDPIERELTFENQSVQNFIEPLTNTAIPAGQTVEMTVIGDAAFDTIESNIAQINALAGFEAITITLEVVEAK